MEYHERSMYSPTNTLWLWDTKIQGSNLSILQNTKPCLLGGNGVPVLKVWGSKLNFIVFALASLTIKVARQNAQCNLAIYEFNYSFWQKVCRLSNSL